MRCFMSSSSWPPHPLFVSHLRFPPFYCLRSKVRLPQPFFTLAFPRHVRFVYDDEIKCEKKPHVGKTHEKETFFIAYDGRTNEKKDGKEDRTLLWVHLDINPRLCADTRAHARVPRVCGTRALKRIYYSMTEKPQGRICTGKVGKRERERKV